MDVDAIGLGYTLGTGRLYCDVSAFHAWAEELLERFIFTHEFGGQAVWDELRAAFEFAVLEAQPIATGL